MPRAPSFRNSWGFTLAPWKAGTSPKSRPVATETARVKTMTKGSMAISVERGRLPGTAASTSLVPQRASSRPIAAPPRDSRTLSVNNWRTTRPRSAPERGANGELTLAGAGAREQKIGDVGAGDDQHEPDGAHQ